MTADEDPLADITAIYQRLGQGLVDTAPPGWASIRLRSTVVDTVTDHVHGATAPDGSRLACTRLAPDTRLAIEDLRAAFYQDGKGAWLTMTCTISAEGQIGIDVDYEDQPGWEAFVPDAAYVADLERFPREEQHVPAWMRTILDRAASA